MKKWFSKSNPYRLPTVVVFAYALITAGTGSSEGFIFLTYLQDVFKMLLLSLFAVLLFSIIFMSEVEDDNALYVAGLLWGVVAVMGNFANLWN